MKGFLHKLFQVTATAAQIGNLVLPVMDEHSKIIFGAVLGVAQSLAGLNALYINPDGTSAKVAYQPKTK